MNKLRLFALAVLLVGCQTVSNHRFVEPAGGWQTRNGQLLYRGAHTSLIGEVLVRTSKSGEFELTFTKGPGVALMMIRQDAEYASAEGPLARGRWSGRAGDAPERLRGWFTLRDAIAAAGEGREVTHTQGAETFTLRF